MNKLIFVNRFFSPDSSATSQMLSDLAFELGKRGNDVHVVTSRMLHSDTAFVLPAKETIHGVTVHRLGTTRFGKASSFGRSLDYLSFFLLAFVKLVWLVRSRDVLVAKTDPPLISVICMLVAVLRRCELANWVQDLFPEIAQAAGVGRHLIAKNRLVMPVLSWFRDLALRRATTNILIGEQMHRYLLARGLEDASFTVIPNWADIDQVRPIAKADNPLREEWGLNQKFVVEYSGNMGIAHDFETILLAAKMLLPEEKIQFLLIGAGMRHGKVRSLVADYGLTNVQFQPFQPREKLANSLSAGDVHLVSLRPAMDQFIVPSKIYGIAAAGRPTLFLGKLDGELAGLLSRCGIGLAFESSDASGLAESIRALAADDERVQAMGRRAREFSVRGGQLTDIAIQWEAVLGQSSTQRVALNRA